MHTYSIPTPFLLFRDEIPNRTYEIERYLDDASKLFMYKFSSFIHVAEFSEDEAERLPILLSDIISIRKLLAGKE